MKIERILIATDGTRTSRKAIEFGFAFAAGANATVLLLGIINPALEMGNPDAGIFPDDAMINAETMMTAHLIEMKQRYAGQIDTELLSKDAEIKTGINAAANKWHAQLVIMGAHRHSAAGSLFHAGIVESVLHTSAFPVCFVPVGG